MIEAKASVLSLCEACLSGLRLEILPDAALLELSTETFGDLLGPANEKSLRRLLVLKHMLNLEIRREDKKR